MPRAATAAHVAAWTALCLGVPAAAQPDEPDDCSQAMPIALGGPGVRGLLDPATDTDWFAFEAVAGHLYMVNVDAASAGVSVEIAAADTTCAPIQSLYGGTITTTYFTAAAAGTHRVRVTAALRGGEGPTPGLYALTVLDVGPSPDTVGDTPQTAAVIAPGDPPTAGACEHPFDTDWYRVTLAERTLYQFDVTDRGCQSTIAALMDRDGRTALHSAFSFSDDVSGTGVCTEYWAEAALFYVESGRAGDYFIQVYGSPAMTEYDLAVTAVATYPAADDHGGTCADATALVPGGPAAPGVLEPGTDVDAFSFEAQAGRFYSFAPFRLGLRVVGPDCGEPVPLPDNEIPGVLAAETGVHTILVGPPVWEGQAVFAMAVTDHGPVIDDFPNAAAIGAPLDVDAPPAAGVIDYTGDTDAFRFTLPAHTLALIELRGTDQSSVRATYGFDGSVMGRIYALPEDFRLLYTPAGTERTYHVEVNGYHLGAAYTVGVTMLNAFGPFDAHPDDCGQATPLSIGAPPVEASIDPAGDVDWFTFDAAAGHIYGIDLPILTTRDWYWRLVEIREGGCAASGPLTRPVGEGSRRFRASADGPVAVGITFLGGGDTGPYTLAVTDLGLAPDDHPDLPTNAARLRTDGTPIAGAINFAGDIDDFRLWLRPHTFYRIGVNSDDCTLVSATLSSPGPSGNRGDLLVRPAPGCPSADPWWLFDTFYSASDEAGDHLITISRLEAGTTYTISIHPIGCTADTDASGTITSSDISAFLTTWITAVQTPPPANLAGDFSGDTVTDSSDIAAFLSAWLAAAADGCP